MGIESCSSPSTSGFPAIAPPSTSVESNSSPVMEEKTYVAHCGSTLEAAVSETKVAPVTVAPSAASASTTVVSSPMASATALRTVGVSAPVSSSYSIDVETLSGSIAKFETVSSWIAPSVSASLIELAIRITKN